MAIPNKALELNIDVGQMTLNEFELFETGGFTIKGFKAFMKAHSNWSNADVGELTRDELKDVVEKIAALFKESSVPK